MKLSQRQLRILRRLLQHEYTTTSMIGKSLKISDKTIRNDIKIINSTLDNCILSVKGKGFTITDKKKVRNIILANGIIDEQRELVIFNHLLNNPDTNFYDLADTFFISEKTLQNIIKEINNSIPKYFNAAVIRKSNNLYLSCNEETKREIYTIFLMNEIKKYNFDLTNYNENNFILTNLDDLKLFILDFLERQKIQLNDLDILSLIIQIAILLDRIDSGNTLSSYTKIFKGNLLIPKHLCNELNNYYNINLNENEQNYIAALIMSRSAISAVKTESTDIIYEFIDNLLEDTKTYFQVDLTVDEALKNGLFYQITEIIERLESNKKIINPIINEIKEKYPFVYDISIYMSLKIKTYFGITIAEDEIGFIAIHLLRTLNESKKYQLKVAMIDPIGNKTELFYQEKINNYLSNVSVIVKYVSLFHINDSLTQNYDFIMSTISLRIDTNIPLIYCSALLSDEDLYNIKKLVKKISFEKRKFYLFSTQFKESLFFPKKYFNNKEDIIRFLCAKLTEQGYCDSNYINLVLEREEISATSFGNSFAIPHPVRKEASKSGIAILTLSKPINWNGNKVKIVFLFSLASENIELMRLYSTIIDLLDDHNKVNRLLKANNFQAFTNELATFSIS